jgi:hypothetical protein
VSYHEEDAPCLQHDALAALQGGQLEQLRLQPHPAFALMASRHAIHSIFNANRFAVAAGNVNPARPELVLLTRPYMNVETRLISDGTFGFLQSLSNGDAVAQAADSAYARDPDFDLAASIALMLAAGAFQPFSTEG